MFIDPQQALTLPHSPPAHLADSRERWEIACNLRNPSVGSADRVLQLVLREAGLKSLCVESQYTTGPSMQELLALGERRKTWELP